MPLLLIGLAVWLFVLDMEERRPEYDKMKSVLARVTRVIDGDTVRVKIKGFRETVRYIGVDTPESVKPDTPVQCYSKEASRKNRELVGSEWVRLVFDRERQDRYGRLLAYVYLTGSNKDLVNAELLKGGYAKLLTIPPNTKHKAQFSNLESKAQLGKRGLWQACQ